MTTLRVFLSFLNFVAFLNLRTYQLDIKTAFLNVDLKEIILIKSPTDMLEHLERMYKLTRNTSRDYEKVKLLIIVIHSNSLVLFLC